MPSPWVSQRNTEPGRSMPDVSFVTVVTSGCHDGQFFTSVCTFQTVRSGAWITMFSRVPFYGSGQ